MALLNDERETIICFNETPEPAHIFTYNKRWQKHLEDKLKLKPTYTNKDGGKEYDIDKKRIPMPRVPRKLTAEARKNLVIRLGNARRNRAESSKTPNTV